MVASVLTALRHMYSLKLEGIQIHKLLPNWLEFVLSSGYNNIHWTSGSTWNCAKTTRGDHKIISHLYKLMTMTLNRNRSEIYFIRVPRVQTSIRAPTQIRTLSHNSNSDIKERSFHHICWLNFGSCLSLCLRLKGIRACLDSNIVDLCCQWLSSIAFCSKCKCIWWVIDPHFLPSFLALTLLCLFR